ncbi:MAG TPA: hypothetical protein VKW76_02710 [Candidatus Binatia bacterium]|nr:hypothetical protein [Candidatus Binatia bacterium]
MAFEWADLKLVLFAGLTALTLFTVVALVLLRNGAGATRLVRRRLRCPVENAPATVDFVVAANGGEAYVDVAACSLLPRDEPVTCGKVCRSTSVAPFGRRLR